MALRGVVRIEVMMKTLLFVLVVLCASVCEAQHCRGGRGNNAVVFVQAVPVQSYGFGFVQAAPFFVQSHARINAFPHVNGCGVANRRCR